MKRKPTRVVMRLTRYKRKGAEKRVLFYTDSAAAMEDGRMYLACGWRVVALELLSESPGPGPGQGVTGTITMRPHTKRDRERYAATVAAMSDA